MFAPDKREKLVREIQRFIEEFDFSEDSPEIERRSGHGPMDHERLLTSLEGLLRDGIVVTGSKFLDLGSGLGGPASITAHVGLQTYGIEMDADLFLLSQELVWRLASEKLVNPNALNIICGSYFPNAYVLHRANNSVAVRYENADENLLQMKGGKFGHVLFPVGNQQDIYERLGIQLKDFDIFFSYCWGINAPSILEMFSLYAKDEAILLLVLGGKPKNMHQLLHDLNLKAAVDRWPSMVVKAAHPLASGTAYF